MDNISKIWMSEYELQASIFIISLERAIAITFCLIGNGVPQKTFVLMKTINRNLQNSPAGSKFKGLYNGTSSILHRFIRRLTSIVSLKYAVTFNAHGKNYLKINLVSQQEPINNTLVLVISYFVK